jgi:trk system potassium uptake protein TrkA
MRVVILGYGRLGRPAAQRLDRSGHDIVVLDRDESTVKQARNDGLTALHGEGDEEAILADADLDGTDVFAALTDDLTVNVSACERAADAGCRTVIRVSQELDDETYDAYSEQFDEIVYPEQVGAAAAKTALLGGDFDVISALTEDLTIARIDVPEDSPALGTRVVNLDFPGETRVYAHGEDGEDMSIPLPQTRLSAGDSIAVMADAALLQEVRASIRGV